MQALTLFCHDLELQKAFFRDILELELVSESEEHISIKAGATLLSFRKSLDQHRYHYCFLIPMNKLVEAMQWLSAKHALIKSEDDTIIQHSESWNADMFYFYDGAGNVAEFIVHPELNNPVETAFSSDQILLVNEIGMAVTEIKPINDILNAQLKLNLWNGNLTRFAAFGDAVGRFIVVNNQVKKTWVPTEVPTELSPYTAIIKSGMGKFNVAYTEGVFTYSET